MHRLTTVLLFMTAGVCLAGTRQDEIVIMGNHSGFQSVSDQSGGAMRAEYSLGDHALHVVATWKVNAAGVLTEYSASGNDHTGAVTETFRIAGGKASWSNRNEHREQTTIGPMFYVPLSSPPEFTGVLARALLKSPTRKLALLPAGQASITPIGTVSLAGHILTQYQINGLGFRPVPVWLDSDGNTAAVLSGSFQIVDKAYMATVKPLEDAQKVAEDAWSVGLANDLTYTPTGDVVIHGARLFDPRDLSVTPGMSVQIRTGHIVRVAPDAQLKVPAGAESIDAAGRFLMPGLWDNHRQFGDVDGALDLANGVTSARDMGNSSDAFLELVARFDAGLELGPHIFKGGIMDGRGPLAGPTKMRVDTAEEAIQDVNWYADHGYGQINIHSSVKPDLVPIIADQVHARGLRLGGTVPAFMNAQQFVAAGADELQHIDFIVLNFLFDKVKDTRGAERYTAVAEHAAEFGAGSPRVREFIGYLNAHHTVLEPTINVFEGVFCGDPKAVPPGLEQIVPRLPPQARRSLLSGALAPPKGKEDAYKGAFPALLRLLKALHEGGITLIPGSDAMAGYTLHHELELYARAGIPAAEVLRMATLTSAQVVGLDRERGVIAPGKVADLILVDGDPLTRMSDLSRITMVMKSGRIFNPARIETALGITPRH